MASFDPQATSVLIWTRLTPPQHADYELTWTVCERKDMTNPVARSVLATVPLFARHPTRGLARQQLACICNRLACRPRMRPRPPGGGGGGGGGSKRAYKVGASALWGVEVSCLCPMHIHFSHCHEDVYKGDLYNSRVRYEQYEHTAVPMRTCVGIRILQPLPCTAHRHVGCLKPSASGYGICHPQTSDIAPGALQWGLRGGRKTGLHRLCGCHGAAVGPSLSIHVAFCTCLLCW